MHLVLIGWILEYSSRVREVAAYCVDSILMMADVVSWGRLMIKALLCVCATLTPHAPQLRPRDAVARARPRPRGLCLARPGVAVQGPLRAGARLTAGAMCVCAPHGAWVAIACGPMPRRRRRPRARPCETDEANFILRFISMHNGSERVSTLCTATALRSWTYYTL